MNQMSRAMKDLNAAELARMHLFFDFFLVLGVVYSPP